MTVKERIQSMIDRLPERELDKLEEMLNRFCQELDPVYKAFMNAPIEDEPMIEADRRAIEEAYEDIARGECFSWEKVKAELESDEECPGN